MYSISSSTFQNSHIFTLTDVKIHLLIYSTVHICTYKKAWNFSKNNIPENFQVYSIHNSQNCVNSKENQFLKTGRKVKVWTLKLGLGLQYNSPFYYSSYICSKLLCVRFSKFYISLYKNVWLSSTFVTLLLFYIVVKLLNYIYIWWSSEQNAESRKFKIPPSFPCRIP